MIDVEGASEVIRELRIWWINKGISAYSLAFFIIVTAAIWRSPEILRALNERKRIDQENLRRATLAKSKIEKEQSRRGRRTKE